MKTMLRTWIPNELSLHNKRRLRSTFLGYDISGDAVVKRYGSPDSGLCFIIIVHTGDYFHEYAFNSKVLPKTTQISLEWKVSQFNSDHCACVLSCFRISSRDISSSLLLRLVTQEVYKVCATLPILHTYTEHNSAYLPLCKSLSCLITSSHTHQNSSTSRIISMSRTPKSIIALKTLF